MCWLSATVIDKRGFDTYFRTERRQSKFPCKLIIIQVRNLNSSCSMKILWINYRFLRRRERRRKRGGERDKKNVWMINWLFRFFFFSPKHTRTHTMFFRTESEKLSENFFHVTFWFSHQPTVMIMIFCVRMRLRSDRRIIVHKKGSA